jgi:hypothetical protein
MFLSFFTSGHRPRTDDQYISARHSRFLSSSDTSSPPLPFVDLKIHREGSEVRDSGCILWHLQPAAHQESGHDPWLAANFPDVRKVRRILVRLLPLIQAAVSAKEAIKTKVYVEMRVNRTGVWMRSWP